MLHPQAGLDQIWGVVHVCFKTSIQKMCRALMYH